MDTSSQTSNLIALIKANAHFIAWGLGVIGGVILFYNIKDMIRNWFFGVCIRWAKSWEELDLIDAKGDRCFIRKFGMLRVFCLPIGNDNKTLGEGEITMSYVDFMSGKTKKYGKLI